MDHDHFLCSEFKLIDKRGRRRAAPLRLHFPHTHVFGQRDSSTIPELIFENHIFSGCGHILKQSWLTLLA
jgi:hypothetical protein